MHAEDIIAIFGREFAVSAIEAELRAIPSSPDPMPHLLRAIEITSDPTFERRKDELVPARRLLTEAKPHLHNAIPSRLRFLLYPALSWLGFSLGVADAFSPQFDAAPMLAGQAGQTLRLALLEGPDSWARGARLSIVGEQPDVLDRGEAA